MSSSRVWLVTGSSSGFGQAMVEFALKKGDKAVATLRKPEELADLQAQYGPTQLLILKLDVTQPKEIISVFAQAKNAFGRIDVVFNNAGFAAAGELEGTPDDIARKLFETNFFGATNVTREAVRFFREENAPGAGGRLITTSSFVGIKPIAVGGYYSASKHALEAATQAIAGEIDPDWNIKITLIEPGRFRTSTAQKGTAAPPLPAYSKPTTPAAQVWKSFEAAGDPNFKIGDVNRAVAKIYGISELSQPPLRIILGMDAIGFVRSQLELLQKDVDASETWSQNLRED
ncbi:uncharacterized protein PHACADRAFT_177214 [Phanerochaete carnosa HHB-10118-sp]|uniref:NAD(P)-binding protein n=1 Tax=Phanerochaete carnosa (strain HHB-10118-sp) TaxID=650164 RepID=K5VYE2_PHACS|nr:uncharacterized protein PHACADRAFT_177214 [Phanerochaete carnosa HHB-10118-sp]EKM51800.1 hypothetical protein PHACADRAFT_177214 [Phanerochaete carnosa HHB-10118-sp]